MQNSTSDSQFELLMVSNNTQLLLFPYIYVYILDVGHCGAGSEHNIEDLSLLTLTLIVFALNSKLSRKWNIHIMET